MVPFSTTITLDPEFAIHLSVFRSVIVDLVAVVALHVLIVLDEAALAENKLLAVFELNLLEDGRKNVSLPLIDSFVKRVTEEIFFQRQCRLDHAQWTELVETLLDDFGDVTDGGVLAHTAILGYRA